MDLGILYVSLAAGGGGILSALLGWLENKEKFSAIKFFPSILRVILAGVVFAIGYTMSGRAVSMLDILIAVAAGAGIDAGVKRATGTALNGTKS